MEALRAVESWLFPYTDERREWTARPLLSMRGRDAAVLLAVWRWFAFGWMFGIQVWSWSMENDGGYALAYLTNDSMWLNIFYFAVSASISTVALVRHGSGAVCFAGLPPGATTMSPSPAHQTAWRHARQLSTALLGIAVSWETVVVILYWAMLYAGETGSIFFMRNVNIHGTVAIFPWIDVVAGSHLLPDRTVVVVLAGALIYLVMNAGVSKTVAVVYSVLAWDKGSNAILVIGALLGVALFYFLAAAASASVEALHVRGAHGNVAGAAATPLLLPSGGGTAPRIAAPAPNMYASPSASAAASSGSGGVTTVLQPLEWFPAPYALAFPVGAAPRATCGTCTCCSCCACGGDVASSSSAAQSGQTAGQSKG